MDSVLETRSYWAPPLKVSMSIGQRIEDQVKIKQIISHLNGGKGGQGTLKSIWVVTQ